MEPVSAAANEFLSLAESSGKGISNMQLNKMLYIAQGFSLALLDDALFDNDVIQAWKYGPVIPSIYNKFKHLGHQKIDKGVRSVDISINGEYETPELENKDKKKMVELTWVIYGGELATDLAQLTHKPGTPWSVTYEEPMQNKVIQNDLIKFYYNRFVENLSKNLNYSKA